jgi:hypothetical protein
MHGCRGVFNCNLPPVKLKKIFARELYPLQMQEHCL